MRLLSSDLASPLLFMCGAASVDIPPGSRWHCGRRHIT